MERNKSDVTIVLASPIIEASKLEVGELVTKWCKICVHYKGKL